MTDRMKVLCGACELFTEWVNSNTPLSFMEWIGWEIAKEMEAANGRVR